MITPTQNDHTTAHALINAYLLEAFGIIINLPNRDILQRHLAEALANQRETIIKRLENLDTYYLEGLQTRSAPDMVTALTTHLRNP